MIRRIFISLMTTVALITSTNINAVENYSNRESYVINASPHISITSFLYGNVEQNRGASRMQMHADWKNIGTQPVIAFEIVVLKYDAFNNRMMGSRWVVNGHNSADWRPLNPEESSTDGIISFREEEIYTAIVYVRQARLKDGTIWKISESELSKEMTKVAPKISEFGSLKPDPKEPAKKD